MHSAKGSPSKLYLLQLTPSRKGLSYKRDSQKAKDLQFFWLSCAAGKVQTPSTECSVRLDCNWPWGLENSLDLGKPWAPVPMSGTPWDQPPCLGVHPARLQQLPALACWDGTESWSSCLLVLWVWSKHKQAVVSPLNTCGIAWTGLCRMWVKIVCFTWTEQALGVRCEWSRSAVDYPDRKPCQMWPLLQVLVCLVYCLRGILSAFSNCQVDTKVSATSEIARRPRIFNSSGSPVLQVKSKHLQRNALFD